jgi:hypothetical protein
MHIALGITEVIVNDHFNHVDIKSPSCDLGADKNLDLIFLKPLQSNYTLHLTHISMQALDLLTDLL